MRSVLARSSSPLSVNGVTAITNTPLASAFNTLLICDSQFYGAVTQRIAASQSFPLCDFSFITRFGLGVRRIQSGQGSTVFDFPYSPFVKALLAQGKLDHFVEQRGGGQHGAVCTGPHDTVWK